jgi:hypothetical protein
MFAFTVTELKFSTRSYSPTGGTDTTPFQNTEDRQRGKGNCYKFISLLQTGLA